MYTIHRINNVDEQWDEMKRNLIRCCLCLLLNCNSANAEFQQYLDVRKFIIKVSDSLKRKINIIMYTLYMKGIFPR